MLLLMFVCLFTLDVDDVVDVVVDGYVFVLVTLMFVCCCCCC